MRLILEIRTGSNAGQKIVVEPGTFVRVGRKRQADAAFPGNTGMSGLHFSLECTGDACWVRDLNSTNGTWVNGQRVSEAVLNEGDEVTAGEATFAVRIEHDRPTPATSAGLRGPGTLPQAPASRGLAPAGLAASGAQSPAYGGPASTHGAPGSATRLGVVPASATEATSVEPATAQTPAVASPKDRLLEMLRSDFQPLYAILDAACSADIYKLLVEARDEAKNGQGTAGSDAGQPTFRPAGAGTLEGGAQYESLYEGKSKAELVMFAPYLVRLLPESKLLEKLVNKGWGKSWGIYVTCDLEFGELRRHFRHFLMVKVPDGTQVYFRFYDPRVLRTYLPTCLPDELNEFFGQIRYYLTEDEKLEALLRFSNAGRGVGRRRFPLAPEDEVEPDGRIRA
jgi:pSer/pThr/pTyr-binding forkhead associated (FHA) protein